MGQIINFVKSIRTQNLEKLRKKREKISKFSLLEKSEILFGYQNVFIRRPTIFHC